MARHPMTVNAVPVGSQVTPPLDVERISDVLKQKRVSPSNLKFGFLGLGNMGQGMVKNLINSGHHITVWNRTPSKVRTAHFLFLMQCTFMPLFLGSVMFVCYTYFKLK